MKVVRIVSELDFGGVEQVLANSIPRLSNLDQVEITILVLGKGGRVAEALKKQGVNVVILGRATRIPNFSLISTLSKLIHKIEPDVVHCQGAEANFHGILAARLVSVPVIIGEEIGIPNHHSYWKYIFKWVYSQAHQIIAISEAVKEVIVRIGEVKAEKIKVIFNPVQNIQGPVLSEVEATVDRGPLTKNFVFVTTCRLVPIKNLDRLIAAFAGLVKTYSERSIILKIIGDGPERENLEFRIQNSGLEKRVELLGFQSDVWSYLAEADAFILPSLREGSSVSLAEAMTAGLPSIVTKVGGATEILGNSQSGILIDPLSTYEIQHAMQSILDLSEEERNEMGKRAQEEAKRFSVDNYIKNLLSVYLDH